MSKPSAPMGFEPPPYAPPPYSAAQGGVPPQAPFAPLQQDDITTEGTAPGPATYYPPPQGGQMGPPPPQAQYPGQMGPGPMGKTVPMTATHGGQPVIGYQPNDFFISSIAAITFLLIQDKQIVFSDLHATSASSTVRDTEVYVGPLYKCLLRSCVYGC
ncbi:unnamed protein product, partial [Meganyctiphanes norvegica]